jgi:toxin ParE1/3/4
MTVRFTKGARSQFLSALRYIKADKPDAAERFRKKSEQSLDRLKDYSDSGRQIPEFPNIPYREVVVAPYRYFYRVEGDTILIVAVWHAAQVPKKPV